MIESKLQNKLSQRRKSFIIIIIIIAMREKKKNEKKWLEEIKERKMIKM